jgi:hypothetical protein
MNLIYWWISGPFVTLTGQIILGLIDCHVPFSSVCAKMHKVGCIWFKSLDCGGTLALLNTHNVLPVTKLLSALHTAKQTRSHRYHCSTPTAFMNHTVPAITLLPNNHNKQKEKENTFPCKVCLCKWKLKQCYFNLPKDFPYIFPSSARSMTAMSAWDGTAP